MVAPVCMKCKFFYCSEDARRNDLKAVLFRKLTIIDASPLAHQRHSIADYGYALPSEKSIPPFTPSHLRLQRPSASICACSVHPQLHLIRSIRVHLWLQRSSAVAAFICGCSVHLRLQFRHHEDLPRQVRVERLGAIVDVEERFASGEQVRITRGEGIPGARSPTSFHPFINQKEWNEEPLAEKEFQLALT